MQFMKLKPFCFSFFLWLCSAIALGQDAGSVNVTLHITEGTLKEAFHSINAQTGLSIDYTHDVLDPDRKISISVSNSPLTGVMNRILAGTKTKYMVKGKSILILAEDRKTPHPSGETPVRSGGSGPVKGLVTDDNGQPLSGVTVTLKGSSKASSTNQDGLFETKGIAPEAILIFSCVGFKSKEVAISGQSMINVQLARNSHQLSDVVVTALNFRKNPRSLGYSVAQLDGSKVSTVQTPNIISALSGKIAGVDVSNIADGVAGTKRVVIRGAVSLTASTQPLWVIDGIIIDASSMGGPSATGGVDYGDGLTGINPDDVESISVLKGNAAAALYGSRASNGVILVTTKRGKPGGKTHGEFSSSLLMDKFINPTNFQYEYGQTSKASAMELPTSATDAYTADNWGHKLDGTPAVQFDGVVRPFSAHKDNYGRFFRNGSTITNTAAISGSTSNSDYRISVSDLRNTDIVPNAGNTRTGINSKLHSKFGRLDLDAVLDYSYEKAMNRPFLGGNTSNIFYSLLYLPGNIDVNTLKPGYLPDGTELEYAAGVSNPYFFVNKVHEDDERNRVTGSVALKYQLTDWLYARGRMTRDYYLFKRMQYVPEGALSTSTQLGSLEQASVDNTSNNYEFIIGVDPVSSGKFHVNAFAGGNVSWRAKNQFTLSGNTFVNPGIYTFNNLQAKTPSTNVTTQRTNSLFGSMELSYDKYLYLTLTARDDWFSTLPLNNNNLVYPSAALSFVFSDALQLPSWISSGKLRVSSAQVSGDPGPGQLDLSYRLSPTPYNSQPLEYINGSNIPNRNLKPLLSTDYEVGLEIGFLNEKVGFEANYYNRSVKNDIVTATVSDATGYSTAVENIGKLSSKGIELSFRATPVQTKNFTWNLTATFSTNTNKVIALGNGIEPGANIDLADSKSGNGSIQLEEGKQYGGIYGFDYKTDAKGQRVFDNNGLPLYNTTPVRLGNGEYTKLMGFGNTFTYKNFSLYFLLDGKFGASIYSETNAEAYSNGKHKATLPGRETGLVGKGNNQSGGVNTVLVTPQNISSYYKQVEQVTQQFVYNASFVKLREVALRYSFPRRFLTRTHLAGASLSLVGRNLLILYKDKHLENIDPESSLISGNAQGIERMVYPPTRNFGLTLRLGF
jgi:TonB-linked SusC/RagA family outer membrane protein